MKLSKEQKEFAIKELDTCSRVELLCDGYEISLRIQRHKMKLVVGIFVNDTVKGCWCTESSEHPEASIWHLTSLANISLHLKTNF